MFTERATTRIFPIILAVPTQKYLVDTLSLRSQDKSGSGINLIQSTLQDIKKSLDEDNEAFLHSIQKRNGKNARKWKSKRKGQGSQIVKTGFRNLNA